MKKMLIGGLAACALALASCRGGGPGAPLPSTLKSMVREPLKIALKHHVKLKPASTSKRHIMDASGNLVDNGFESGGFTAGWQQCGNMASTIESSVVHSGSFAALTGNIDTTTSEEYGLDGVCQQITVPTGGQVSFWVNEGTSETSTSNADQEADLLDMSGNTITTLYYENGNTNGWVQYTYDLSAYAGQSVQLFFGIYGSGSSTDFNYQYVDDVVVSSAGGATPTPAPTSGPTATPAPTSGPTATPVPTPVPTIAPTPGNGQPTPFPTPAGSGPQGTSCGTSCGVQRWHIKTLDDGDEGLINWLPTLASVSQMAAIPVPSGYQQYNDTTRYAPTETQVYTVRAVLTVWKEESDHDFHIVLVDPNNSSSTMIGEMPDPGCSAACDSGFAQIFGNNRSQFQTCFGTASTSFMNLPSGVVADVTGVPLFDALHGQTGVAPNGIELHPILSVHFISGC